MYRSRFLALAAEFAGWRTSPAIVLPEAESDSGTILGFVQGLRLSAKLIYELRELLRETSLKAHWGQVLDRHNRSFSRECDVIIHSGHSTNRWNGGKKPVMDFAFVRYDRVRAVISCKSKLTAKDSLDHEYCESMSRYVGRIYLFAECCEDVDIEVMRRRAIKAGYHGFWALYTLPRGSQEWLADEPGWMAFVKTVHALAEEGGK